MQTQKRKPSAEMYLIQTWRPGYATPSYQDARRSAQFGPREYARIYLQRLGAQREAALLRARGYNVEIVTEPRDEADIQRSRKAQQ